MLNDFIYMDMAPVKCFMLLCTSKKNLYLRTSHSKTVQSGNEILNHVLSSKILC